MARAARRRPWLSIGVKLALTYLVPTALLLGALSFVSYRAASSELEAELGKRLAGLAASTATQVRGSYLVVLSAESTVLAQRRLGVDLKARALDNQVQLIRALGGGYVAEPVPTLASAPLHP